MSSRTRWGTPEMQSVLRRRKRAERRFRWLGRIAIGAAVASLVLLLGTILSRGVSAFRQTQIELAIHFDPEIAPELAGLTGDARDEALRAADFGAIVRNSLRARFPEVQERRDVRALQSLVSTGARLELRRALAAHPELVGRTASFWLPADDEVDLLMKGHSVRAAPEANRRLSDRQLAWIDALAAEGKVRSVFNTTFLTGGDSREPELAGLLGAAIGSLLTLAITLLVAFPLGVCAAVHLEEFAARSRLTDFIEVNINNLAAVPSIVFGLLGLAFFLGFLGLPRSAPVVGGLTLALMTLPTIIIAGRASIRAVPPSIREAARGLGASPVQVVLDHVLPLALPGILTGTIIGTSRALGETAPLLMIGMVAFIADVPTGFTDPATVLPVQIFLWADSPERAFVEKTSGAILVLLAVLIVLNATAIGLRQKFERRW